MTIPKLDDYIDKDTWRFVCQYINSMEMDKVSRSKHRIFQNQKDIAEKILKDLIICPRVMCFLIIALTQCGKQVPRSIYLIF